MPENTPAPAESAAWSLPRLRFSPPNPFYLLSAATFLHATGIWAGQQGRELPDATRLILIGSYLLAMALTALAIVRLWRQWADARSVVLIVLLLFAELALSFDDALLRDRHHGGRLLVMAFAVACGVSELLLRGLRLNFPARFRVPYYAQLALLFLFPLLLARPAGSSDWSHLRVLLYAFNWLAAGSLLLLLPAVRMGARGLEQTGTPWTWPMYPWPAFVFLGICLLARSLAQCLSFDSASSISLQAAIEHLPSAFGASFVAPFILVLGVLIYEACGHSRSVRIRAGVLYGFSAASLVASFGSPAGNPMSRDLLASLTTSFAGPPQIMLAVLAVLLLSTWARGDRSAVPALFILGLLQSVIDRHTVSIPSLVSPRPDVLFVLAVGALVHGLARRRSTSFVAGGLLSLAACSFARRLQIAGLSEPSILVHGLLVILLVAGLGFEDRQSRFWRSLAAVLFLVAEFAVSMTHFRSPDVSLLYSGAVVAIGVAVARARHDHLFAILAAVSMVLLEANAVWLATTFIRDQWNWRGAPLLMAAWVLLLGGLHFSAAKGGALLPLRRWLLAETHRA